MEMDKIFMLVLLIVIIAGFYWFQNKIESQNNKRKRVTFSKGKKRRSHTDSSNIETELNDSSISDISVDSVSMGSLSFASSDEESMGSISSSDILSDIDDDDEDEEDDNDDE
jgi:hypothetical protein